MCPPFIGECHLRFRVRLLAGGWGKETPEILVAEHRAGSFPFSLHDELWTVEVRPEAGVLSVQISEGSEFSIHNILSGPIEVIVRGCEPISVPSQHQRQLGWLDPSGDDKHRWLKVRIGHVEADIDPREKKKHFGGALVTSRSNGSGVRLLVEVAPEDKKNLKYRVEIVVPKMGISLTSSHTGPQHSEPGELLYVELDLLRFCAVVDLEADQRVLDVALADFQVDWQSAFNKKAKVVMVNRGISSGSALRPFFRMVSRRVRTSSPEMCLQNMRIELDELEVSMDDHLVASVFLFLNEIYAGLEDKQPATGDDDGAVALILRSVGASFVDEDWELPPKQWGIVVERMFISEVKMHTWVLFKLQNLSFLPNSIKNLIKLVSFSNELSLEGALLRLHEREILDVSGSVNDFSLSLVHTYTGDLIHSLASVIGFKSSLLNIPRVPLKYISIGGTAGCHLAQEVLQHVESLTFDCEFSRRQREIHRSKRIRNVGQGFTAAISDFGDGVGGMFDCVRKPVAGYRYGGLGGFCLGLGLGVVSSVVKPVAAVGHALADLGSGFSAQVGNLVSPEGQTMKQRRLPRLLVGPLGAVTEYSELDAWVGLQMRTLKIEGVIEAVIPLALVEDIFHKTPSGTNLPMSELAQHEQMILILVLTPDSLMLLKFKLPDFSAGDHHDESEEALVQRLPKLKCETRLRIASSVEWIEMSERRISLLNSEACPEFDVPVNESGSRVVQWRSSLPLRCVEWQQSCEGKAPQILIEGDRDASRLVLPVPWEFGRDLVEDLFKVLSTATHPVEGDWASALRAAMARARHESLGVDPNDIVHTCEVWEVERLGVDLKWQLAYLPTDTEQKSRWMNEGLLAKHPLCTGENLTSVDEAIRMLPIWAATGPWEIVRGPLHDEEGWQYGTQWGSTAWGRKPRPLFDLVRRRKWQRKYHLKVTEPEVLVGRAWMREKAQREEPRCWRRFCWDHRQRRQGEQASPLAVLN